MPSPDIRRIKYERSAWGWAMKPVSALVGVGPRRGPMKGPMREAIGGEAMDVMGVLWG